MSFRLSMTSTIVSCLALSLGTLFTPLNAGSAKKWVGTWAASPYSMSGNMPSSSLSNSSLRQIVRVSIGGDTLRVKFTNGVSSGATTMNAVTIAQSTSGADAIDAATLKQLKFSGNANVTINANATVTSDPVAFNLTPSMRLAITIYYGQTASTLTGHVASRGPSYMLSGDKTTAANFSGNTIVEHWYTIQSIDVLAPGTAACVAALGNSITDGYGLSGGLQNRWTDAFSVKLLANPATALIGVLNEGIGATNVASGSNSGISRYKQDVLDQAGIRWFIIFYGVNDINGGASASTITNAYKTMITDAHAKNIKVYGATITPFNGHSYYSTAHEQVRSAVNAWIRTPGNCDGVIDFDKVVRDPSDTTRFLAAYKNDGLHPNAEGYKALGESIDLKLFTDQSGAQSVKKDEDYAFRVIHPHSINGTLVIAFETPHAAVVSLKVYSILGKEIMEIAGRKYSSGRHTVALKTGNLAKGMYFYSLRVDKVLASQKMIY